MLRRISEVNIHPAFDLYREYEKIEELFSLRKIVFVNKHKNSYISPISIEEFMASRFLDWHLRGTFTKLDEMRESMQIDRKLIAKTKMKPGESGERVLLYLQFLWNCLAYLMKAYEYSKNYSAEIKLSFTEYGGETVVALMGNADALLFRLNAERYFDEDKKEHVVYYRDTIDDAIVEEHTDIRECLIEYRRVDTIHNLQRKEEILCTLFKKFESFRNNLKNSGFDSLQSDTGFILNFARHTPHKNDSVATKFHSLSNEEKEIWYDKAYNMFVACLAILPYIDAKSGIADLKKI